MNVCICVYKHGLVNYFFGQEMWALTENQIGHLLGHRMAKFMNLFGRIYPRKRLPPNPFQEAGHFPWNKSDMNIHTANYCKCFGVVGADGGFCTRPRRLTAKNIFYTRSGINMMLTRTGSHAFCGCPSRARSLSMFGRMTMQSHILAKLVRSVCIVDFKSNKQPVFLNCLHWRTRTRMIGPWWKRPVTYNVWSFLWSFPRLTSLIYADIAAQEMWALAENQGGRDLGERMARFINLFGKLYPRKRLPLNPFRQAGRHDLEEIDRKWFIVFKRTVPKTIAPFKFLNLSGTRGGKKCSERHLRASLEHWPSPRGSAGLWVAILSFHVDGDKL